MINLKGYHMSDKIIELGRTTFEYIIVLLIVLFFAGIDSIADTIFQLF